MQDKRFESAVTLLAFLSRFTDERPTSEFLGVLLQQSPSALRRLFTGLERSGLIRVRPGPHGGAMLARSADQITLADVFRAVGPHWPLGPARNVTDPWIRDLRKELDLALTHARSAVEVELAQWRIADLVEAGRRARLALRTGRAKLCGGAQAAAK